MAHVALLIGRGVLIVLGAALLIAVAAANLYLLAMGFYAVMGQFVNRHRRSE